MRRWKKWQDNPSGRIYFTRFFDVNGQGFIKIGRSIHWLPERMKGIALDAWAYRRVLFVDWDVLVVMPGGFHDERKTQHRLRRHMICVLKCDGKTSPTEFFWDRPAVCSYIEKFAEPVSPEESEPDERFSRWLALMTQELGDDISQFGWLPSPGVTIRTRLPIYVATAKKR